MAAQDGSSKRDIEGGAMRPHSEHHHRVVGPWGVDAVHASRAADRRAGASYGLRLLEVPLREGDVPAVWFQKEPPGLHAQPTELLRRERAEKTVCHGRAT